MVKINSTPIRSDRCFKSTDHTLEIEGDYNVEQLITELISANPEYHGLVNVNNANGGYVDICSYYKGEIVDPLDKLTLELKVDPAHCYAEKGSIDDTTVMHINVTV